MQSLSVIAGNTESIVMVKAENEAGEDRILWFSLSEKDHCLG